MESNRKMIAETLLYGLGFSVAIAALVFLLATVAYADEIEDVEKVVDNSVQSQQVDQTNKTLGEISGKLDGLEEVNAGIVELSESVDGVESKIDSLIVQGADPEPAPVERLTAANQQLTINAYGNVSSTNQYASYAKQTIPKMGWDDDYVFVQDSSSSYVLVWGDLDYHSASGFTGQNAHFVRWYYAGTGTGYLVQSGDADVDIHVGSYVVLSNLGEYPILDDGICLLRMEVAFYAICAALLYTLGGIARFLLRNRA